MATTQSAPLPTLPPDRLSSPRDPRGQRRTASCSPGASRSAPLPTLRLIESPVDPPRLALGHRDRTLHVLAAGAVIGKHVEHHEVGDRGCCLLADRAEPARGEHALAGFAEDRPLRIGRPYRLRVVGI